MRDRSFRLPDPGAMIAIALAFVPIITAFQLITRYSYNFPYWDDWPTLIKFYVKDQPLEEYWRLYNDHRIVLPRVIMLLIGRLTALDMRVFMYVNLLMAAGIVFLLWQIFRKTSGVRLPYLVLPAFSFLFISLGFYPGWIIANSFYVWFSLLAVVAALWVATCWQLNRRALSAAILFGIIGSLSTFYGNLIWLLIPLAWWLRGERRFLRYLFWFACAALVLVPYIAEYLWFPTTERKVALFLPGYIVHFGVAFIGSAVSGAEQYVGLSRALPAGIIGLIALPGLVFVFRQLARRNIAPLIPWLALGLFVILAGLSAGVGRAVTEGVFEARAARFDPVSALFWIAIVAMLAIILDHFWSMEERGASLVKLACALLVFFMGSGWLQRQFNVIDYLSKTNETIAKANNCLLLNYENAPDECLKLVNPQPQYVREYVKTLAERGDRIEWMIPRQFPLSKATIDNPALVHLETRQIDDAHIPVIFAHAPSQIDWTYAVPQARRITLYTGVLIDIPAVYQINPGDGVEFEIRVKIGDETKSIFRKGVSPRVPGQGFQRVEVDLTPYTGQEIHLMLSTATGATDNYDWALWLPSEIRMEK